MFQQSGSITGNGELKIDTNTEAGTMAFNWFITDSSDEIVDIIPSGISLVFHRRLLNSVRKDETGTIIDEYWEDFASNPFDATINSISDTFVVTDQIRCTISGMASDLTFNLNLHQR